MSKGWAGGSTTAWRKLRASVLATNLATNAGQCRAHIEGVCTGRATQVHHVHGRAVTGDVPAHLMAVCGACNQKIGDPQRRPDPPHRPLSSW